MRLRRRSSTILQSAHPTRQAAPARGATSLGLSFLAFAALVLGAGGLAHAQVPSLGQENRPGSVRPTLPDLAPPTTDQPIIPLPPVTLPSAPSGAPFGQRVLVREIRVIGNTVLPESAFKPVVEPYLNKELASSDLQVIRDQLTLLYVQRGYVNSGAIIPDQDVVGGVVSFQIVEGRLSEVDLVGVKYFEKGYLVDRLTGGDDKPLHVPTLEERMQLLLQDPLVRRMNVELGPGLRPGEARLRVQVEEGRQVNLDTLIANDRSPNVGTTHGAFRVTARNLTGHADPFYIELNRTYGQYDVAADYNIPLNADDTRLHLRGSYYNSSVIDPEFEVLDIGSTSTNAEVGFSHPLYQTPRTQLRVGGYFVNRWSSTTLLDEPFSFSEGVKNGETKLTILRFTQELVDRTAERVIAARSTFSFGVDALGATNLEGSKVNGKFSSWLGQFQYFRRFNNWIDLVYRTDVQLAADPLFSIEQFAVGGINTVRGYRENQVVRDSAVVASIEPRFTVYRQPLPLIGDEETDGAVQIAPFIDYGRAWFSRGDSIPTAILASVGIGVRWQPFGNMQTELYYGHAIREEPKFDPTNKTLQDHGIHFRITTRLY